MKIPYIKKIMLPPTKLSKVVSLGSLYFLNTRQQAVISTQLCQQQPICSTGNQICRPVNEMEPASCESLLPSHHLGGNTSTPCLLFSPGKPVSSSRQVCLVFPSKLPLTLSSCPPCLLFSPISKSDMLSIHHPPGLPV